MLRDVFYYGNKPNVHPREKFAESLEDARQQCSTEHFWIINEFSDYRNFDWDFDFEFLPDEDVWAESHNNVWPSQHQKDSGTWLCPKEHSDLIIYRADVDPVKRKNIKTDNWILLDQIDESKFDFSWHPDPSDPPYIYKWGCKFFPAQLKHVLEYHAPNATDTKYMDTTVELKIETDKWIFYQTPDADKFDFTWRPDPMDPPYIYVWGNKYIDGKLKPTVEYHALGATDKKYMPEKLAVLPEWDKWEIIHPVHQDSFDFSWRPDPREPNMNYVFGNSQYDSTKMPTIIYKMENAIAEKHMPSVAKLLPQVSRFQHLEVSDGIDYSWVPDPTAPPYIYAWGNQWNKPEDKISIQYAVEGATEYKYMEERARRKPCLEHWSIPEGIDYKNFDYSWEPSPADPPFIYEFATQWQKTGGPKYHVDGATEVKYMDIQKVKKLVDMTNWTIPQNIDVKDFDFSWHPDATSPPYIYHFPTQWALSGGPVYTVPGATEVKYLEDQSAKALPNKTNWEFDPTIIDESSFDFSWHPYAEDEPYIYQFGTQWQKTGGPRYITPGTHKNSPISYVDTRIIKAKRLPSKKNWEVLDDLVVSDFDYSWHPDETEEPYVYHFGNNLYPAEIMPTVEYVVPGAKQVKYVHDIVATLGQDRVNWEIPDNVDVTDFDFSWMPNPKDPPYIYEFSTQWQKTGGPRYVVDGATEVKYVDGSKSKRLPSKENWTIPANIDVSNFDFSWHPDATSPPYIYNFATQWALSGGPVYTVPGATEVKYVEDQSARALPDKTNWEFDNNLIDENSFDFSWHPYVEDQPYVYIFGTQWQKTGGPKYITPGCHKNSPVKYIDTRILKARRLPNENNWSVLNNFDVSEFDYSWHPDETEEPFIYQFGNKYYPAEEMPTMEYRVKGATQIKYVHDTVATLAPDMNNWEIPDDIDIKSFDFGWKPSPLEPPYIYQFGTQHQKTGGPVYRVENATEVKYIETVKAKRNPSKFGWEVPNVDITNFDFSWHPDATSPPFIYQFGTQWALTGGPRYVVKGATEVKYVEGIVAKALPSRDNWEVPNDIAENEFDFSWHPYAEDDPFIYQFGTQHQRTGGPRYVVPGATKVKYIDTRVLKARKLPSKNNWDVPKDVDVSNFDFSWHHDETAPPYIYQFGTILNKEDGPRYISPDTNNEIVYLERVERTADTIESFPRYTIKTTLEDLINEHPDEMFWALNPHIDYANFDFDWKPNIEQSQFVQVFGSSENSKTQTYLVNATMWLKGFTEFNWVEEQKKNQIDMFYVDRGNKEAQSRFELLKSKFPHIQKTRYLNSWVDTVNRCTNRATNNLLWVLNSELDYTGFDFDYYPNPWQMKMVHVFGTQWSHWGTTFMVNRETFAEDTKYIKIIEHLSNLNFVKNSRAKATKCLYDIVVIDHGNTDINTVVDLLTEKAGDKTVSIVKYNTSYLNTLKEVLKKQPDKRENYIWLCSSICDYKDFDFSYVCDPFAREQLHVFPSGKQKFGDTFFLDVNKAKTLIEDISLLEEYNKVNYNSSMRVQRLNEPVIVTNDDTLVEAAKHIEGYPYAVLITEDNKLIDTVETEPMNLWSPETKTVLVTSTGGSRIIVPREAKDHIKKELYDYPYIKKSTRLAMSKPLDIVFLSNGETGADENYEHLLKVTKGIKNRVVRVDGVNGRVQAYHAAVEASETPWAFTVFAKLKVSAKFDWNWQPDRLQVPKHYIFQAKNPVNGLVYGHQAMIAYNKKLTLANQGKGLDFTLDDEHEVVQLLSGIAQYNTDEFSTWRTAFREVLKLKQEDSDIARERLDAWLNKAEGNFAQYSIKGALDADEYYDEVNGDFDQLKLSYEWAWLRKRFEES